MPRLTLTNLAASLFLPHLFMSCYTRLACIPQTWKLSLFLYTEVDVIIRRHHFYEGFYVFLGQSFKSTHMFCHIDLVTGKKKTLGTTAGGETWHSPPRDASQHLWHIMKAAWQKCSLSFSKRDFLEIPRGMYWPSSTLRDRGSGMKSLSHNQSLQGAEHMNNKWLKTACPQQTQWYHRGIQTDITDELTPCAAAWLTRSRDISEGDWLKFEVSTVRFR